MSARRLGLPKDVANTLLIRVSLTTLFLGVGTVVVVTAPSSRSGPLTAAFLASLNYLAFALMVGEYCYTFANPAPWTKDRRAEKVVTLTFLASLVPILIVMGALTKWPPAANALFPDVGPATGVLIFVTALALWIDVRDPSDKSPRKHHPYSGFPFTRLITVLSCVGLLALIIISSRTGLGETPAIDVVRSGVQFVFLSGSGCIAFTTIVYGIARLFGPISAIPRPLTHVLLYGGLIVAYWSVFWYVPLTPEPENKKELALGLTMPALVVGLPFLAVAMTSPTRLRKSRKDRGPGFRQTFERNTIVTDVIRAQLLGSSILQRFLPFFAISLPLSIVLLTRWTLWSAEHAEPLFGVTLAWLGPFIYSLVFLNESFIFAYELGLRRCVQRLQGHVVVLGFGDIGRRFVRELFNKDLLSYSTVFDHINQSRNILMSDGRLAKVLLRVAVVEVSEEHITGAIASGPAGRLAVAPLTETIIARKPSTTQPSCEYVVPVVIGDATNDETQRIARLQYASFVASLIRRDDNSERSQSIVAALERLKKRGITLPTALCIHSSSYLPFVLERAMTHDLAVHSLQPAQLEGQSAGNILYACYDKHRTDAETFPRLALCGRGRRVFHSLDSFLKNFDDSAFEQLTSHQDHAFETKQLKDAAIFIITTDETLLSPTEPTAAFAPSAVATLKFGRYVSRQSTGIQQQRSFFVELNVVVLRLNPAYYDSARKLMTEIDPDVLFFADHTGEDELTALAGAFNAIGRKVKVEKDSRAVPAPKVPQILVCGETGRRYLEDHFEKAMTFYDGRYWSRPDRRFPGLEMDRERVRHRYVGPSLIDVLDEPVERLLALVDAYQAGKIPSPGGIELNFCNHDAPGSIATILSALAGLRSRNDPEEHLSITNTRLTALSSDEFAFRSFAYLRPLPTENRRIKPGVFSRCSVNGAVERALTGESRGGTVLTIEQVRERLAQDAPTENRALISIRKNLREVAHNAGLTESELLDYWVSGNEQDFRGATVGCNELLTEAGGSAAGFKEVDKRLSAAVSGCCGMPTCPIEGVHKSVEGMLPRWEEPSSDFSSMRQRYAAANALIQRRVVYRHYLAGDDVAADIRLDSRGWLGHVSMLCRRAEAGTFAVALSTLLRQPLEEIGKPLLNLTYVAASECHDSRYGVFTCYGRPATSHRSPASNAVRVVRRIVISPVSPGDQCRSAWYEYAGRLKTFLNKQADGTKSIFEGPNLLRTDHGPGWEIISTDRK